METLREKKVSDLENRLELMKEYPGSIFISIHQNQFGSPIYSGTQVFYSPNSQTSQELAQIIQEHAKADLDEMCIRDSPGKILRLDSDAAVLDHQFRAGRV